MKIRIPALVTALIVAAIFFSACKKEGDEVAVVIDKKKITVNEFNRYYYMFAKMMLNMDKEDVDKMAGNPEIENHPSLSLLNKNKFMDFLVSRKLLYNKAFEDDSMNRDDLKTISELSDLQFVSSYYLSVKLKDEIQVSDADVNEFYKRNIDRLKGVPMNDEAVNWMKQQVFMEKLEIKSNQFIMDLLAESKVNREGFRKYLTDLGKKQNKKEEPSQEKTGESGDAKKAD
ncbi:MAG: hypothetical protein JW838_16370 [Spirochaetes bacterium]|nr:hypothetical protein [Spirochaetota bacterium]